MTHSTARRSIPILRRYIAAGLALLAALWIGPAGAADSDTAARDGRTPPRLSLVDGDVSFWRQGDQDWSAAQVNIALAPGDYLHTTDGKLELQIGAHAFVRADGDSEIQLANQEPDFIQLTIASGRVTADVRTLPRGHTIELDTPNSALRIEQPGYYRVDVGKETTTIVTRRGGRTAVTPTGGHASEIEPNEEAIIDASDGTRVATYRAPELDRWDQWNYDRTDDVLNATSERYVPPDMYGVRDLDRYGYWRTVPTYGRVWVPASVPPTWAPYTTGHWIWDAYYGWTWVDEAPWGWAPYHYGRWVYTDSYWAWAPGPIAVAVTPVYAPALVAFFAPAVQVSIGAPFVGWVALGWGEPVIPWWGASVFVGVPWWGGWCGPHVVNQTVVNNTTIVNVNHITYTNSHVPNAVVAVPHNQFTQPAGRRARIERLNPSQLQPVRGALPVKPVMTGASMTPPHAMPPSGNPATTAHEPRGRAERLRNQAPASSPALATQPQHAAPPMNQSRRSRIDRLREQQPAAAPLPSDTTHTARPNTAPPPLAATHGSRADRLRESDRELVNRADRHPLPQPETPPSFDRRSVVQADQSASRSRAERLRDHQLATPPHLADAPRSEPAVHRPDVRPVAPPIARRQSDGPAFQSRADRVRAHAPQAAPPMAHPQSAPHVAPAVSVQQPSAAPMTHASGGRRAALERSHH